jgi:MFS family permease
VRRDLQKPPEGPAEPLWRAAVTGIRYVWSQPLIRVSMLLIAASNFVFQALILVLVVLAGQRGGSPSDIGLMLGLYSAGGLAGAFVAGRLHRRLSFRTVLIGINWVWAILLPLNVLTTNTLQIGALGALCAFVGPLWNVVIFTYAGTVVPNELLGRVMSAAGTLTWGVMPLASLTGGLLLTWIGPTGSIWSLSAVMLAAAVVAILSPAVRHAPTLESVGEKVPADS